MNTCKNTHKFDTPFCPECGLPALPPPPPIEERVNGVEENVQGIYGSLGQIQSTLTTIANQNEQMQATLKVVEKGLAERPTRQEMSEAFVRIEDELELRPTKVQVTKEITAEMKKNTNTLAKAILVMGAILLILILVFACSGWLYVNRVVSPEGRAFAFGTLAGQTSTPSVTADPRELTPAPPTTTPAAQPSAIGNENLPARAENVELAGGSFKNTLGQGTEGFLAEPGVLLVGPEFPQSQLEAGAGAIERFSPANQYVLSSSQNWGNVPEGGFALVSANHFTVEVAGKTLNVNAGEDANAIFVVRGLYRGDGDRNHQATFSNFVSGHALFTRYPLGAFVSEDHVQQVVRAAISERTTNCGDSGCSRVLVVYLDLNTSAHGRWWVDRNGTWTLESKNY
jgi:hypothetical protein